MNMGNNQPVIVFVLPPSKGTFFLQTLVDVTNNKYVDGKINMILTEERLMLPQVFDFSSLPGIDTEKNFICVHYPIQFSHQQCASLCIYFKKDSISFPSTSYPSVKDDIITLSLKR